MSKVGGEHLLAGVGELAAIGVAVALGAFILRAVLGGNKKSESDKNKNG